jgi:hypothetical protein
MIQKDHETGEYSLVCDMCGETESGFETFQDAVDFKRDRDNGWRATKDGHDTWHDLCPSCNTQDTVDRIKGLTRSRNEAEAAAKAASQLSGGRSGLARRKGA